jgi:hypothetical protein
MTRLLTCVALGAALVVLVGANPSARADVIYDNFNFGDTYDVGTGWTIGAPQGQSFQEVGCPFTVSGTYTLTQITVAAGWVTGPNVYTVWLMDDVDGVPGNVIEEFDFADLGRFGQNNAPLVGDSVLNPTLDDGSQYWLVCSTSDSTWAAWNWNTTGDAGPFVFRQNGGDWLTTSGTLSVFRVEGDPVEGPRTVRPRADARPVAARSETGGAPSITILP